MGAALGLLWGERRKNSAKKNTGVPEGALFLWENAGEERNGRNGLERRNSGRRAEEKWRDGGQRGNGEMAERSFFGKKYSR